VGDRVIKNIDLYVRLGRLFKFYAVKTHHSVRLSINIFTIRE